MKYSDIMITCVWGILAIHVVFTNPREHKEVVKEIQSYQTTIDSLINKNQRLNDGFIELYDDWSRVQVENDNLTKDNKYLRRLTR